MSGLYIHIPYCYRACTYCNFHFSTNFKTKEAVISSMIEEMKMRSKDWNEKITSIYFGGGTPSVLTKDEFTKLYNAITENFDLSNIGEVTLECNPEDLIDEKLESWRELGVNRLSIGNQSFQDDILKKVNRQHTSIESIEGIERARKQKFNSISLDVIIGLPGLNKEILLSDLNVLLSQNPEHISAYQLSVEDKTTLSHQIKKENLHIPSEEEVNEQFLLVDEFLKENGYEHYEVSNYAKKGFRAQHNASYWTGDSYLGIGPGAHSFKGNERRWNVSNNNAYVKAIANKETWYEGEILHEKDCFNEKIMTSLRISNGLDLSVLKSEYPDLYTSDIDNAIQGWLRQNLATLEKNTIKLNMKGWLISDKLASDLFVI